MKKVKYIRISSGSQKIYRQQSSKEFDATFVDVISGAVPMGERPEGKKLMEEIRNGNVSELHTTNVDRLGRSMLDILQTLKVCSEHKVNVCIESLGISSIANGKENQIFSIIITILAQISQMERESIKERTRIGKELAIARGVKFGRREGAVESIGKFLQKPAVEQIRKSILRKPHLTIRELALLNNCSTKLVMKVKKLSQPATH